MDVVVVGGLFVVFPLFVRASGRGQEPPWWAISLSRWIGLSKWLAQSGLGNKTNQLSQSIKSNKIEASGCIYKHHGNDWKTPIEPITCS